MKEDPTENEPVDANPYQSPDSRELPEDADGIRLLDLYVPLVLGITASGIVFAVTQAVYTAFTVSWGGLFREEPSEFVAMLIFSLIVGGILAFLASLICVGVILSVMRLFARVLSAPSTVLVIGTAAGVFSALVSVTVIASLQPMMAGVPLIIGGVGGFFGARWAVRQHEKTGRQDLLESAA